MPKTDLSFNDIRDLLSQSLPPYSWIRDVYPAYLVYEDDSSNKLWKRDYTIGADNKVTLGDASEVMQQTSYEPVEFAATELNGEFSEDGDFVILKGKIFEAGDYPDKNNFSLSPAEMAAAASSFTGAPLDYAHVPGPLDGKLGNLSAIEVADNGTDLIGTVKMPKWLDSALGDTARKVSCTWDIATKTIKKLALVNNPRVSDAVLQAAFTEFEASKTSQTADDKNKNPTNPHTPKENNQNMSEVNFADTPEYKKMQDQLAALEAANKQLKDEARRKRAEDFAEGEIAAGRSLPAERAGLVAIFELAAKDDETSPVEVTFAEGKTGGRVDLLRASHSARASLGLTSEVMGASGTVVLTSQNPKEQEQAEFDNKEVDTLLEATDMGRKAKAALNAGR